MMKKLVMLFAATMAAGGIVWAQPVLPVPGGANVFDNVLFDAVPTLSTEARYSAGRFGSDVDDFIDPRFHDPDIGTFLFLGGFPARRGNDVTNTQDISRGGTEVSLGFGQTFGALYLAVYYGGRIVNAGGSRVRDMRSTYEREGIPEVNRFSEAYWRNNLAVLASLLGFGIRLDLIMDAETQRHTVNGSPGPDGPIGSLPPAGYGWHRTAAPTLALTVGTELGNLAPYIRIGYRFNDRERWAGQIGRYAWVNDAVTGLPSYQRVGWDYVEYTVWGGSALGVFAGVELGLGDDSAVGGQVRFATTFATRDRFVRGDRTDSFRAADGMWGLGFTGYYSQSIDAGIVAIGFRPRVTADFSRESRNDSLTADSFALASVNYWTVGAGVDLGIRVQPTAQFAFFTGAGLNLVRWDLATRSDSELEQNRVSAWTFRGIHWDPSRTTVDGNLGLGMTFTPAEGIVIGAGLNTVLDRLFWLNLEEMQAGTGSWFGAASEANNAIGAVTSLFHDWRFDLTVSLRLGN